MDDRHFPCWNSVLTEDQEVFEASKSIGSGFDRFQVLVELISGPLKSGERGTPDFNDVETGFLSVFFVFILLVYVNKVGNDLFNT